MSTGVVSRRRYGGIAVAILVVTGSILLCYRSYVAANGPQCNQVIDGWSNPLLDAKWHGQSTRSGAQALNFGGSLLGVPGLFVQFYQGTCQANNTTGFEQFILQNPITATGIETTMAVLDCLNAQQFVGFGAGPLRVDMGVSCVGGPPQVFSLVRDGTTVVDTHTYVTYEIGTGLTVTVNLFTPTNRIDFEVNYRNDFITRSVAITGEATITSTRPLFGNTGRTLGGQQPSMLGAILPIKVCR